MLNPRLASNSIDLGNEVHLHAILSKFTKKLEGKKINQGFFFIYVYTIMVLKLNLKSKCCFRAWAPLGKKCLDESEIKN